MKIKMIFPNKNFTGKSIWLWIALLSLFLAACPTDTEDKNGKEEQNETTLTISNNCSQVLLSCNWNGTQFGTTDYDKYGDTDRRIHPGEKSIENVDSGSGYIFFEIYYRGKLSGRSQELVTLEKGESKTFVFLDSTVVVSSDDGKTYALADFVNQ
jgi:hypothetical protein